MGFEPTYPTPYTTGIGYGMILQRENQSAIRITCSCVSVFTTNPTLFYCSVLWSLDILITRPATCTFSVFRRYSSCWSDCRLILLIVCVWCHIGQHAWPQVGQRPARGGFAPATQGDPTVWWVAPRRSGLPYGFKCVQTRSQEVESRDPWKYNRFVPPVVEYNLVSSVLLCVLRRNILIFGSVEIEFIYVLNICSSEM